LKPNFSEIRSGILEEGAEALYHIFNRRLGFVVFPKFVRDVLSNTIALGPRDVATSGSLNRKSNDKSRR